ncbi:Glucan endo-1,3-beta-glucosidase 4 [Vitis vinifera]|uniref:glucan endo-1,3-beta-D-glucosidase n=1 Tax=Vitis vinifera TaxID=29760 RepID=A0A438JVB2_VITVI|nr:Glucan endo-1,3-beta-glucosidase 4 [Vitis vinifera]
MISPRVLERRESSKNLSDSVTEQLDDSSVTQDDPFDASFAVYPLHPSEVEEGAFTGGTNSGAFVGVNIGTDVSNLPSASVLVGILKAHQITHVRLYDADAHMLNALANTGIEVVVGVTNEEVLGIGQSPSTAATWINRNVAAYVPSTNITAIAVGSEVLTSIPHAAPVLVPAMNYLHKALVASNLNFQIKVSAPQSLDIIPRPFPPSTATFNSTWNSTIYQMLQFLKNTNSYFMLNAYPYYGYTNGDGIFPIDYALFRSLPSVKQIVDPNTLFHYESMLDAMVDAAYYSVQAFNFSVVPVVVTESGWPWLGPPSQPDIPINTYIYELLNEDKRSGPVSERNWGVFLTNGTAVYPLSWSTSLQATGNSSTVFCVAKEGADSDDLEKGLNWACGQSQVNCTAIQEGQPCYSPNTYQNHASYAYNDYYQKMRSGGGTCDFRGTATTTTADPNCEVHELFSTGSTGAPLLVYEKGRKTKKKNIWMENQTVQSFIPGFIIGYGSCIFSGSSSNSSSSGGTSPSSAFAPESLSSRSPTLQVPRLGVLIPAMLLILISL